MSANRQVRFDSDRFLAGSPAFTLAVLAEAMGSRELSRAREWAKYHLAAGRLKSVERGLYAAVPTGADADRFTPDPFLVGVAVRLDAVFGYHAALQLLGAAHSEWSVVDVFTERRRRSLTVGEARLEFLAHPAALTRARQERLGTRHVPYQGRRLAVTGPERTLLDGFRSPRRVGGLEELVESAAGFASLDLDLVSKLLATFDVKLLWAAAGWFLETYRSAFQVDDRLLTRLERHRPTATHYLPRSRRGRGGTYVKRWNLVLPSAVVRMREPGEA